MKKVLTSILFVIAVMGFLIWDRATPPLGDALKSKEKRGLMEEEAEKGPKPEHPDEAMAFLAGRLGTPHGENPNALNFQAMVDLQKRREKSGTGALLPVRFEDFGPGNFAGRIRGLVVKPSNPDVIVIGSTSGGIWKSENGGENWRPVNDFLSTLAICHLLVDPDNENRIYAGTGEGFYNTSSVQGLGIFQSDDFGDTWTQIPATNHPDFYYVNRIARIPGTSIIMAATRRGIMRSTNLGESWQEVSGQAPSWRSFVDIKVDPSQTTTLLAFRFGQRRAGEAALNYLMRSTDSGASWVKLGAAEGLPTTDVGRFEIGFGSDGVCYVAVSDTTNTYGTRGLWRSTNHGATFTQAPSTNPFIVRQGWYNLVVGVDPSNSDRVYLGAVDLSRTLDGGTNIGQMTFWNPSPGQIPNFVHADIHTITFHPTDPNTFWVGCDGGIFKSTDGGDSFVGLNNDLRITQFYGIAIHPDGSQVVAGTQDNGSLLYFGDKKVWLEWQGGDGGFCSWDNQQPNYVYGAFPYGVIFGSQDAGFNTVPMTLPGVTSSNSPFINPFTLDPSDGNRMVAGADRLFLTTNARDLGSAVWMPITPVSSNVTAIAISPTNGAICYFGDTDGTLKRTNDLGTGNQFAGLALGQVTSSDVTDIVFDPHDPTSRTVYVTFADYSPNRVLKTSDGGETWTSIHGNLPNIPMHALSVDPLDPNRLFLGTELGLWSACHTGGGNYQWEKYDYGTPFTRVNQIIWSDDNTFWLSTHGRGLMRVHREFLTVEVAGSQQIEGDGDDFLDKRESHMLRLNIENHGHQAISEATLTLVSDEPGLEVQQAPFEKAVIAANTTSAFDFLVFLDDAAPGPVTANLRAIITTADSEQTYPISIEIAANQTSEPGYADGAETQGDLTHSALLGVDNWERVATQAHSGQFAWFSANVPQFNDTSLFTPWLDVTAADANFSFWLFYDMEGDSNQAWDGTVLEMRTQDSDWFDVGGANVGIPYDNLLFRNNTIYIREAWSGVQTSWRQANLNLGAYQGQRVQLRFHVVCDTATANPNGGVWIDDIVASGVVKSAPIGDDAACDACGGEKGSTLSESYYLAHTPAFGDEETYVGIVNHRAGTAVDVEIFGFSESGRVQGVVRKNLVHNGRIWASLSELFPFTHDRVRWAQVACAQPLEVFGELHRPASRSAYLASQGLTDFAYLPHMARDTATFSTFLATVNGSSGQGLSTLLPAAEGALPVLVADPHNAYFRELDTALNYFGSSLQSLDWAKLNSNVANLAAMEFFTVIKPGQPKETQVASLGLNSQEGPSLKFLHIARDTTSFWTGMVFINASAEQASATETYYDRDGAVLLTVPNALAPFQKQIRLFAKENAGVQVPVGAEWMRVESDRALIGYELFGSAAGTTTDLFTGLQGSFASGTSLVYPHVEASSGQYTAIVALNLGEVSANMTFTLFNADGLPLQTATQENVGPNRKITLLAANLFTPENIAMGAWVLAESSGSTWAGFLLWGDEGGANSQTLSGIQAFSY